MPRLPKHDPLAVPASHEEIKQWRLEQERAPIEIGGHKYDVDPDSLGRMRLAAKLHDWVAEPRLTWRTATNSDLIFTVPERFNDVVRALDRIMYRRMQEIHLAAIGFKRDGVTLRELQDWEP